MFMKMALGSASSVHDWMIQYTLFFPLLHSLATSLFESFSGNIKHFAKSLSFFFFFLI